MRRSNDVRCGDCEHYSEEGCEQAAEALVLEGWPRMSALPDDSADASRCPEFSACASPGQDLDDEPLDCVARVRAAALRHYQGW